MVWKLHVYLGEPPVWDEVDPNTGLPTPEAKLTKDTRVEVDVVTFKDKPEGNPWLAPDDPPWGEPILKDGKVVGQKKGGIYSFVMEEA
jgi:hypothetical protein